MRGLKRKRSKGSEASSALVREAAPAMRGLKLPQRAKPCTSSESQRSRPGDAGIETGWWRLPATGGQYRVREAAPAMRGLKLSAAVGAGPTQIVREAAPAMRGLKPAPS